MGKQETLMNKATKRREALKALAGQEGSATLVVEPNEAALIFGLSLGELKSLGKAGKEMELRVVGDKVVVEFKPPVRERRRAYLFLYHLLEPAKEGTADRILKARDIPPLAIEILGDDFEPLRVKGKMDELDLEYLHRKLGLLRESMPDIDLPDVHTAYSTQTL